MLWQSNANLFFILCDVWRWLASMPQSDAVRLCAASYIDNLYFPSRHASSAVRKANVVEAKLLTDWNLKIKPGSRRIVVARGHCHEELDAAWTVEESSDILGRTISGDNSIRTSWDLVKSKMWKSFFGNVRCKHWRKLGLERRLQTLERAVKPLFSFHCVAWAPQNQVAKEVDQLQRRMTAAAIT